MAKKKMVGIGKTKHWNEGRRVKNATKRLKNRIRYQSDENKAKNTELTVIGRKREGNGKQHLPKKKDK